MGIKGAKALHFDDKGTGYEYQMAALSGFGDIHILFFTFTNGVSCNKMNK